VLTRGRDILRRHAILPLEVTPTERVDEVVDDLCALDGSRDVICGTGVALDPSDAFLRCVRRARDGDELVVRDEGREKCSPDDSGRAEDRDPHTLALEANSSK
jgi:hypothetical protein